MLGAVKLAKYVYVDLYKYSGYDIGFDRKGYYSISNEIGKNVIIFGVDISVDYEDIAVSDILDIHKYLVKKNGIV